MVEKNVASNPDAFLLHKDPRRCFKNYEDYNPNLTSKDSRIRTKIKSTASTANN